jgi:hypothetical protein
MKLGRIAWSGAAVLVAASLSALPALAEVPDSHRARVTDPNVLESMGLPRDAQNVYVADGLGQVNEFVPEDFGGRDTFLTLPAKSFMPRQDATGATGGYTGGAEGCCVNLTRAAGADTFWDAPVYLDSGVSLKEFRLYVADGDAAADVTMFVFENCQAEAGGTTTITTISTAATTGTGNQAPIGLVTPFVTVNNRTCSYTARINFGGAAAQTLQKIRLRFARQVSPGPGVASFSDVPTTHPQFRFVEALVASGITSGCAPGSFCPDSPLTRGQMAVFLSVALGLSFQ